MAIRGNRRAEREAAEVLEDVVDRPEPRFITLGPGGVTPRERVRREGRQAQQIVAAVHDHVDGQVIAGQHQEVRSARVPYREAIPLLLPVERRMLEADDARYVEQRLEGLEREDPT